MFDQEGIRSILKSSLPQANDELLSRLSNLVEQEMETYGRAIIRRLVMQDTHFSGQRVDTKA
ncbi:MAG: hypothetical protein P4N59_06765 [Negativicutes bacterium]|nr:hypothetical protein [Negativicutes bacterium]